MAPRPILKARLPSFTCRSSSSCNSPLPFSSYTTPHAPHSPHVHFPPTPSLVSTQPTHSSSTYDRAPIAVSPNSCELPERGGRFYSPSAATHAAESPVTGSYFDCGVSTAPAPESTVTPALIPDISESEDSDEYGSPLSIASPDIPLSPTHSFAPNLPSTFAEQDFSRALSLSLLPSCPPPAMKNPIASQRSRSALRKKFWKRRISCEDAREPPSLDGCLGGF